MNRASEWWFPLAALTLSIASAGCESASPITPNYYDPNAIGGTRGNEGEAGSTGSAGSSGSTGSAGSSGLAGSGGFTATGGGGGGGTVTMGGRGGSEVTGRDAAVDSGRVDAGATPDGGSTAGDGAIAFGPGCQQVAFTVTVRGPIGDYDPKNVGAIWISDSKGKFVKTLRVWANRRRDHLSNWETATGKNLVDAVTSATISSEGARAANWNCTDAAGKAVPSGAYRVNVEWSEGDEPGEMMKPIDFTIGAGPVMLTPPDQTTLKSIRLQVTPTP